MRKIILIYSLFIISSFQVFSANILTDQAAIGQMIKARVPAPVIAAARSSQTKETIKNLIFAAAPVYPLARIFDLYPHANSSTSSMLPETGEEAFYHDCLKDVYLYEKFFLSLAGGYLDGGNPLRDLQQIQVSENSKLHYGLLRKEKNKFENIKNKMITNYFLCYDIRIKNICNLIYLYKLLESEFSQLVSNRQRKIPDVVRDMSRNIRCYAPYLRAEMYVFIEHDLDKAIEFYRKSLKETGNRSELSILVLQTFAKYKIAELMLNSYYPRCQLSKEKINPTEAIVTLKSFSKMPVLQVMSALRLGQYYLGFFGGGVSHEAKGIEYIQAVAKSEYEYVTNLVLADYYLGITDPEKFDLPKANYYLAKAEAEKIVDCYIEYANLRQGELAMCKYGEACEIELQLDIAKAIFYFEKIPLATRPHNYLYAIYRGEYGNQYKDDLKAQESFQAIKSVNPAYADGMLAMQLYKAGNIDGAVALLEQENNDVRAIYFLACIKSNPRFAKHYNENMAMAHFIALLNSGYDYRDTSARFLKLFLKSTGIKPAGDSKKCWRYLLQKLKKNIFVFPIHEMEQNGFLVPDEYKKKFIVAPEKEVSESPIVAPEKEVSESPIVVPEKEVAESPVVEEIVSESSLEQDEENLLSQEIEAINLEAPVVSLEDPYLQKLYDDLGSKIRWRSLQKFVKEFGGTVDLESRTMTFPHCEGVFTFHLPHGGNPLIDFTGYWRKLKHMIDHEYAEKCRAESEKALS